MLALYASRACWIRVLSIPPATRKARQEVVCVVKDGGHHNGSKITDLQVQQPGHADLSAISVANVYLSVSALFHANAHQNTPQGIPSWEPQQMLLNFETLETALDGIDGIDHAAVSTKGTIEYLQWYRVAYMSWQGAAVRIGEIGSAAACTRAGRDEDEVYLTLLNEDEADVLIRGEVRLWAGTGRRAWRGGHGEERRAWRRGVAAWRGGRDNDRSSSRWVASQTALDHGAGQEAMMTLMAVMMNNRHDLPSLPAWQSIESTWVVYPVYQVYRVYVYLDLQLFT
ncbi:hypothetical protein FB45DRAFT_874203 [Roridomyces roridus]|uniref:Uncharacterized protein n=1 Tax=Roridomyces roridus TaxID=1738132 RepID=A0AAD7FDL2_9AGAR|nr:hypothetical protein FB45DRAFT_874203 [Roridomyces roridus]